MLRPQKISLLIVLGSLWVTSESSALERVINNQRQAQLLHLLKQDCGSCHGMTLQGGLGPALLPQNLHGKSAAFLTSTILTGRPGTAMPPWQEILTTQEAQWLSEQLLQGIN